MKIFFNKDIKTYLIGCLVLLALLSLASCGKDEATATGRNNRSGYYTNHRVNNQQVARCRVVGMSRCGHTLDCGRYGRYYCQRIDNLN